MVVPGFVDHLVFRVADVGRTEHFYAALLGEPANASEYSVMYLVGGYPRVLYAGVASRGGGA